MSMDFDTAPRVYATCQRCGVALGPQAYPSDPDIARRVVASWICHDCRRFEAYLPDLAAHIAKLLNTRTDSTE